MTNDPYMEAINAGAAALAKPYRDPDTITAFVETFPTIAAARVIDAALPHLREVMAAERAASGPCPAVEPIPNLSPNGPQNLHALCDLRAGHAGQHEVHDETHGHFRWSERPAVETSSAQCLSELWQYTGEQNGHLRCERTFMHPGYCINGVYVWDEQLNQVLPHEE